MYTRYIYIKRGVVFDLSWCLQMFVWCVRLDVLYTLSHSPASYTFTLALTIYSHTRSHLPHRFPHCTPRSPQMPRGSTKSSKSHRKSTESSKSAAGAKERKRQTKVPEPRICDMGREGEREREREILTDKQADGQTGRQPHRQTRTKTDKHRQMQGSIDPGSGRGFFVLPDELTHQRGQRKQSKTTRCRTQARKVDHGQSRERSV